MTPESTIDLDKLAQHLDDAVIEVCDLMLGTASTPVVPETEIVPTITASIRLFGTTELECRLCGTDHTAKLMAEALVGTLDENAEALIADSFGELCNMVAGSWKNKLLPEHNFGALTTPAIWRSSSDPTSPKSPCFLTRFYRFGDHVFGIVLSPRQQGADPANPSTEEGQVRAA